MPQNTPLSDEQPSFDFFDQITPLGAHETKEVCPKHTPLKTKLKVQSESRKMLQKAAVKARQEHQVQYLTVLQVAAYFNISRASVWRLSASNPDFPKPVSVALKTTRWLLSEVQAYEAKIHATALKSRDGGKA